MMHGGKQLDVVIGYWSLVIGYWSLVIGGVRYALANWCRVVWE